MLATPPSFKDVLLPYQESIEGSIRAYTQQWTGNHLLKDACQYALLNGGKRFRPILVLMIAKALGLGADVSLAAIGIEFLHTASLIADDLPCMDNDDERRDKPSTHKVYGESVALLATYALISAGYECLVKNAQQIKNSGLPFSKQIDQLCVLAIENVSYNTGILGATGGQFLDLYPPHLSVDAIREIIDKKTVTLFEISFVLGWLFGGGNTSSLSLVKECALHFGIAFQLADDLGDQEQDRINGRLVNLANACGLDLASRMFHEELDLFKNKMSQLGLYSGEFQTLEFWLRSQVEKEKAAFLRL